MYANCLVMTASKTPFYSDPQAGDILPDFLQQQAL
jgi:hypothetical protein